MWHWYRNAQICYAYLKDVSRDSHDAEEGTLGRSSWFTRGWTLQELLAPSSLVLYDADWHPLGTRKDLAETISSITSIDRYYLEKSGVSFETASIAERMSWASTRVTKRQEDIAYCLLGLFNIKMPLLYGEGTRAFRRLQEEIMEQSDDQSIFAHSPTDEGSNQVLATSSGCFHGCQDIVRSIGCRQSKPYTMTNRGLQIELPVFDGLLRSQERLAGLNCRYRNNLSHVVALRIHPGSDDGRYERSGPLQPLLVTTCNRLPLLPMYLGGRNTVNKETASRSDPEPGSIIIQSLPRGYEMSNVFPAWAGSSSSCIAKGAETFPSHQLSNRRLILIVGRGVSRTGQYCLPQVPQHVCSHALPL